jgi:hypothetical protein
MYAIGSVPELGEICDGHPVWNPKRNDIIQSLLPLSK